jgi:hypothetical protein
MFLLLISIRGISKWKISTEPATFRLVAQCLNQLCYHVPPYAWSARFESQHTDQLCISTSRWSQCCISLGQHVTDSVHRPCNQVCTNFLKIYEPLKILGVRKNDTRTVSYCRSTSTRSHNTKFGHHSEMAPGICAILLTITYFSINIIRFTHQFLGLHLCSTFYHIYIL